MTGGWQDWIAMVLVAVAAAFLLRRGRAALRIEGAGCGSGGCGACPSARPDEPTVAVLSIGKIAPGPRRDGPEANPRRI